MAAGLTNTASGTQCVHATCAHFPFVVGFNAPPGTGHNIQVCDGTTEEEEEEEEEEDVDVVEFKMD
tara:strand:- start:1243 stop:1440 length:198 start_codon:yes stop_codon:yes gene_type:complete